MINNNIKKECMVKLTTLPAAQKFTSIADQFNDDIAVVSGKYTVNGKSVLGIFSLDLSRPMKVEFSEDAPGNFQRFIEMLKAAKIHVK